MQRTLPMLGAALAVTALALAPLGGATAASSGLAWDSVTKLVQSADAGSVEPGPFDADYAKAAAVDVPSDSGGGGFFGKMKAAVAAGKSTMQMMQTGMAEKHYVAGSKERTDSVSYGKATIVDCVARTVTTLDMRKKTYRIESLDAHATSQPVATHGEPEPEATDDGTKVAIALKTTALGRKEVGGTQTDGYRSLTKITTTKPSGETQSSEGTLLAYYSSYAQPHPECDRFGAREPAQQTVPAAAGFARLAEAMAMVGKEKRFSMTHTGPALPIGRLAMFEANTFKGERSSAATVSFLSERGNVRSVSPDDAAFSVPADFTKQP
ncbi:MAG: hypothetical protein ABI346_01470 [Candidatus Baltobacteraceae bacterium]